MLKRYWFVIFTERRFGIGNIGVTAHSINEAKELVIDSLNKINQQELADKINHGTEIIENIDIQLLDQNHVIPNMGVVAFKGVWFQISIINTPGFFPDQ